jgi:hypothetical protein
MAEIGIILRQDSSSCSSPVHVVVLVILKITGDHFPKEYSYNVDPSKFVR